MGVAVINRFLHSSSVPIPLACLQVSGATTSGRGPADRQAPVPRRHTYLRPETCRMWPEPGSRGECARRRGNTDVLIRLPSVFMLKPLNCVQRQSTHAGVGWGGDKNKTVREAVLTPEQRHRLSFWLWKRGSRSSFLKT